MHQRLKRWESPRKEGRNDKGKGGAARKRQIKKKMQMLRQKLQDSNKAKKNHRKGEDKSLFPFFYAYSHPNLRLLMVIQQSYLLREQFCGEISKRFTAVWSTDGST